jgi:transposase
VMESTGSDFQSVYAALEQAGIPAHVVNARHVKNVPGRKTDISDSEWLAQLGRFGLVKPSFIPPQDLRELRLVSRYRQKLAQTLAGEKNRLHKLLDDAGIKLGAVVSDIDGVSARAMIEGLIEGKPIAQLPELAKGALRTKRDTLEHALEGELSPRHRLVLQQIQGHIRYLEIEMANLDTSLIDAMAPYADYWQLLQTLPGIDQISAALILVEIGTDLTVFGDADHFASWAAPQAPATTRVPASARPARPAKATTPSATCCAKRPMPPGEPTAPCATSTQAWYPEKATSRPSSPWPLKWSARSSFCSPAAKRIATLGLITQRSG